MHNLSSNCYANVLRTSTSIKRNFRLFKIFAMHNFLFDARSALFIHFFFLSNSILIWLSTNIFEWTSFFIFFFLMKIPLVSDFLWYKWCLFFFPPVTSFLLHFPLIWFLIFVIFVPLRMWNSLFSHIIIEQNKTKNDANVLNFPKWFSFCSIQINKYIHCAICVYFFSRSAWFTYKSNLPNTDCVWEN